MSVIIASASFPSCEVELWVCPNSFNMCANAMLGAGFIGWLLVWGWASHLCHRGLKSLGKLTGRAREMKSWFFQALLPCKEQNLRQTPGTRNWIQMRGSWQNKNWNCGQWCSSWLPASPWPLPPSSTAARVLSSSKLSAWLTGPGVMFPAHFSSAISHFSLASGVPSSSHSECL